MRPPRFLLPFGFAWVLTVTPVPAGAEEIVVATYNVEHFESHFEGHRLRKLAGRAAPGPAADGTRPDAPGRAPTREDAERSAAGGEPEPKSAQELDLKQLIDDLKHQNDEDNWEVAEVITDNRFSPDVLVIEEGCSQENLEYFNDRWLRKAYGTVITFPTNTTRGQHLCMLLKPGFRVIERKDQYYLEKDPDGNDRADRLFARGPAFALVETPGGYRFWAGVTHQKSKSGNNLDVTRRRLGEAARTHQIMQEPRKRGPADVILLGDMNDELGLDGFEQQAGADAVATLVGPPADGFALATRPLVDAKENSFGGYWNPKFRSLIDHVVVTPEMKDRIADVKVFRLNVARVASDHFPVYVRVRCDPSPKH